MVLVLMVLFNCKQAYAMVSAENIHNLAMAPSYVKTLTSVGLKPQCAKESPCVVTMSKF